MISLTFDNLTPDTAQILLDAYTNATEHVRTFTTAPVQPSEAAYAATPTQPTAAPAVTVVAPTQPTATPVTAPASTGERDSLGIPHNPDVHSETKNRDGTWRRRKHVSKEAYDAWSAKHAQPQVQAQPQQAWQAPTEPQVQAQPQQAWQAPTEPQVQAQPQQVWQAPTPGQVWQPAPAPAENAYFEVPIETFNALVNDLSKRGTLDYLKAQNLLARCNVGTFEEFYQNDDEGKKARHACYILLKEMENNG